MRNATYADVHVGRSSRRCGRLVVRPLRKQKTVVSRSVRKTRKADCLRAETPNANAPAQGAKVHQVIYQAKVAKRVQRQLSVISAIRLIRTAGQPALF